MNNILIFLPYGGVSPHHFSIGLEIIQDHLDRGDQVTILKCNAQLDACSYNPFKDKGLCITCKSVFRHGLTLIDGKITVKEYRNLTAEEENKIRNLNIDIETFDQLKELEVDGYDIGMGAASSFVSYYRDPYFDIRQNLKAITDLVRASYEVYLSIRNHLAGGEFETIYLFNGRYSEFRAAFRAAQSLNITAKLYEYGSDLTKYAVFTNHLPHSITDATRLIEEAWTNSPNTDEAMKKGAEFYELRRKGVERSYYSYTKNQVDDLLPDNFSTKKRNIVIYNSSEDELVAIGPEWANTLYTNQNEGIQAVYQSIGALPDKHNYHIYLRVHPNLANTNVKDYNGLALDPELFTIIPPESNVSTYTLMDHADIVLSFGSTMGIEAAFWGKVSIQLSPGFYRDLGATFLPRSHKEVMELITTPDIRPLNNLGAYKYGYYAHTFGVPRKISKMKDFIQLDSIKGQKLQMDKLSKLKLDLLFVCNNPLKYLRLKLERFNKKQNISHPSIVSNS